MIVITSNAGSTYQARIYTSVEEGMQFRFSASCTEGHLCAAKRVTRKYYGNEAAESVRLISDHQEKVKLIGEYAAHQRSPRTFCVFTFNH